MPRSVHDASCAAPQMHHLLNNRAEVNQRDEKGMTPLHRAAFLAQYDGYLELYEYLLVSSGRPMLCRIAVHSVPACGTNERDYTAWREGPVPDRMHVT